MLNEALEMAKDPMEKAIERLQKDNSKIRAGRANPSLLDDVRVDNYGSMTALNQVATVSVADARMLMIKPWDRNMVAGIEKAIINSDLGLNPSSDGTVLRVPIPPLTEERRKGLVKQVHSAGEEAKIAIRGGRKDGNDLLKSAEKDKDISEDDLKRGLEQVQKLTDEWIKKVDVLTLKKEKEILDG